MSRTGVGCRVMIDGAQVDDGCIDWGSLGSWGAPWTLRRRNVATHTKGINAGLPAGAFIFGGTHPTCALDSDGVTYHCTLASAPAPEISDFQGSKQLIAIDQKIAGGCIGQDHAGMTWDCYIGEEAVRMEILTEDLLGQPELEPGRG